MSEDLPRDGPCVGEEVRKYQVNGEGQKDQSCPDIGTLEVAVHKRQNRTVDGRSGTAEEYIGADA